MTSHAAISGSGPALPPAYRLVLVATDDAPFDAAREACATGEDGDFFWSARPDRLDCAILLHPDLPAARADILAYVALVGLGDAVGAQAPPAIAVTFRWPDTLLVNGAVAGGIRIATAATPSADVIPAWQVLGITVALHGDKADPSPGDRPEVTTLYDEGATEVSAASLAESLSRHLLTWIHRWQEEGFAPISESWLARAEGYQKDVDWSLADDQASGRFIGLDEDGGALLAATAGAQSDFRTVALGPALRQPRWTL